MVEAEPQSLLSSLYTSELNPRSLLSAFVVSCLSDNDKEDNEMMLCTDLLAITLRLSKPWLRNSKLSIFDRVQWYSYYRVLLPSVLCCIKTSWPLWLHSQAQNYIFFSKFIHFPFRKHILSFVVSVSPVQTRKKHTHILIISEFVGVEIFVLFIHGT